MFDILRNLSIYSALVVLAGIMAITASVQYILRRPRFGDWFRSDGAVYNYIQILTVFYGLLLGLVVVELWQLKDSAEKNTVNEANEIRITAELATLLPGNKSVLMNSLGDYVEGVVKKEWPMMMDGQQREMFNASPELDNVRASISDLEPKSQVDLMTYQEILGRYGRIVEARQQRLFDSEAHLPNTLLVALIVGAAFVWGCTFFIVSEQIHSQTILCAVCGGYMFMLVYLIVVLENPFIGSWRVDTTPYERVLDVLQ